MSLHSPKSARGDLLKLTSNQDAGVLAAYGSVGSGNVENPDLSLSNKKKKSHRIMAMALAVLFLVGGVTGSLVVYSKFARTKSVVAETAVPGADQLSRGYNLFTGKYFSVSSAGNIGSFNVPSATTSNTIRLGNINYIVPDGMSVTSDYHCTKQGTYNSVSRTSSIASMISESDSQTYGFDKTTTISASVPVGSGEVGASSDVRQAMLFGNTDEMSESKVFSKQNYNFESKETYQARAYHVQVDWTSSHFTFSSSFVSEFSRLGSFASWQTGALNRNKQVFKFFNNYGSHVIKEARMGAKCSRSIYLSAGHSANAQSNAQATSSSTEISFWGIEFGSSSSTKTKEATYSATGVKYSQTRQTCHGIVMNNACNYDQTAVSLQPVALEAAGLPIWEINHSQLNDASAKSAIQQSVDYLSNAFTSCSSSKCQGRGVCVLKTSFWDEVASSAYDGQVHNSDFESKCICNDGYEGDTCTPIPVIDPQVYVVTANGQYCLDACGSKAPLRTGDATNFNNQPYFFCSVSYMGDRGGFNVVANEGDKQRCVFAGGTNLMRYLDKKCYCVDTAAVVIKESFGQNCEDLCSTNGLNGIVTGYHTNGGKYYACAANTGALGYRGGWQNKHVNSGICYTAYNGVEHREQIFKCFCTIK